MLKKSIKDFGAIGNGVMDDTFAIQDAINAGGVTYFPTGTYKTTKSLVLKEGTVLNLEKDAIIERWGNDQSILINGSNASKGYKGVGNIIIRGGVFNARGKETKTTCNGIVIGHVTNVIIQGVKIMNTFNAHHIEINSSKDVTIDDCSFSEYTGTPDRNYVEAIQIDLSKDKYCFPHFGEYDKTICMNVSIRNCRFIDIPGGIGTHVTEVLKFHDTITIENCIFHNLTYGAIRLMNFVRTNISNCHIINCVRGIEIEGSYAININNVNALGVKAVDVNEGIKIINSQKINVSNVIVNKFRNGFVIDKNSKYINVNSIISESNLENGVLFGGRFNSIVNSKILNNGMHGVNLYGATACEISNCTIMDNSLMEEEKYSNINVESSNNNRVFNNIIRYLETSKTKYGINIEESSTLNSIYSNDFRLSGQNNKNDLGENNRIEFNQGINI